MRIRQPSLIAGLVGLALLLTGAVSGCAGIRPCTGPACADDKRISEDIRDRIKQYPAIEAPNIVRVNTIDHVVYLYGQVETEVQRSLAEEIASSEPGVARVVNSNNFSYQGF